MEATISILYIILSFILVCFGIGWLFPPVLSSGLAAAAFMSILLIPTVVMIAIMQDIFSASGLKSPPAVPSYCFAGNTMLKMANGKQKKIKDVIVGDKLAESGNVTAVMQSSSHGSHIFNLNGVLVTSTHKVLL